MKEAIAIGLCSVLVLLTGVSQVSAQCPTVTTVSPSTIGRTVNPASTYFNLKGNIADGDYFIIDSGVTNMKFEFDTAADPGALNDLNAIRVAIPVPPAPPDSNRAAARMALLAAINAQPTCPCYATCLYANDTGLTEYITVIWKSEAGYGRTNVASGTNLVASNFNHYGAAASHILLTGTNLSGLAAVKLRKTDDATKIITGTAEYLPAGGARVGYKFYVVPNPSTGTPVVNPATQPPAGDYDLVIQKTSCADLEFIGAVKVVDNLLDDSTFSMNMIGNTNENGCGANGSYDVRPGPLWKHNGVMGNAIGTFDFREKAGYAADSICRRSDPYPGPMDDWIWGSLTSSSNAVRHEVWQEISVNFTEQKTMTLSGMYSGGSDDGNTLIYGAELYNQAGTLIAYDGPHVVVADRIEPTDPNTRWANFSVTGGFPAGTTKIKVVVYLDLALDGLGAVLNFDDLLFYEGGACPTTPTITSISPGYGVRDVETDKTITVNGTNFIDGTTTVKLYRIDYEVTSELLPIAAPIVVNSTQLTARFNLTGAKRDYWSVKVENLGCPAAYSDDSDEMFNVVLAGPALTNGSFELPTATGNACYIDTWIAGDIEDWTSVHISPHGGGSHYRDDISFTMYPDSLGRPKYPPAPADQIDFAFPKCPPPDSIAHPERIHWASVEGPTGSASGARRLMQTVTATSGHTYSLSGYFAATGPNNLGISLLNGGIDGTTILGASKTVLPGPGEYDWTFGYVMGAPSGDIMTARWDADLDATGSKFAHADALVLEECTAGVTVSAIAPTILGGGVTTANVTVTGTGFSPGTPEVYLVQPGNTVKATNVQVESGGMSLTCSVAIPLVPMSTFEVIVRNNGCFATLSPGATVAPTAIVNGGFEDPRAAAACTLDEVNPVFAWQFADQLDRDRPEHRAEYQCPYTTGNGNRHYASMMIGTVTVQQAWQTIKTNPYGQYTFAGNFSGGGHCTVTIKLVDGIGPNGQPINSTTVSSDGSTYDFRPHSVPGYALSNLTTVVWEMTGADGATHADGLTVTAGWQCNSPWADVEPDGDVDQDDFAFFQRCLTTGNPANGLTGLPQYCGCFDRKPVGQPDGLITDQDLTAFTDCAKGPGVSAACN